VKNSDKIRMRTKLCLGNIDKEIKISLSVTKNTYLIGHYNAADFSILEGFDEIKQQLSIVSKSFLTMVKPIKINNTNIHIRDTIMLAPGGQKSLAGLGKLYEKEGDFNKRQLTPREYENMRSVLENDKQLFEDYALQDVVITLKHAVAMEQFNFTVNKIGIPVTLSSIGRNYVANEWGKNFPKFLPYQPSSEYTMGNADEIQTPKGLFATGSVGVHMSYFIANYKGGRNESFMYGVDESSEWIDYDLTSAYTTGMSEIELPDYYKASLINPKTLEK